MLAVSGALLVQVNVVPEIVLPLESWAVAVYTCWALTATKLLAGLIAIAASVPVDEPPHPDNNAATASNEHNRCMLKRGLGGVA